MEILRDIPFELDVNELLEKLRVRSGSEDSKEIVALAEKAAPILRPKALYEVMFIESKGEETVTFGGVTFTSRVLRVNLEKVERVFAYIATCGHELDAAMPVPMDDFIKRFWVDTIKEMALWAAQKYLSDVLETTYGLGRSATMHPGAGTADIWPIEQQRLFFSMFGNVEELIGVRLTDSFLMIPNKSVSGIYYPTEVSFKTCQLCPRHKCANRQAPFDKKLLKTKYKRK